MSIPPASTTARPLLPPRTRVAGVLIVVAIGVVGLLWAKWLPYGAKVEDLLGTRRWAGSDVLTTSGAPGSGPTVTGALDFTQAYALAVWKAALVAVLLAAALEALIPRAWLLRPLQRRTGAAQGLWGGLVGLPSMMCTCCTAPVVVGLRRRGAPVGASVAYWLANPVLNPAVLVFLALTLPTRFVVVRALVGMALVVGAAVVAARIADRRGPTALPAPTVAADPDPVDAGEMARRFARALARYLLVIVPEYLLVVVLTGAVTGLLSDWTVLGDRPGLVALVVVGALLVIPTGGEIPVVAGLLAAGAGLSTAGVLLLTLPALSLPSLVMVARSLSLRVTAAVAGLVVVAGVCAGAVLALSSG
ncbi:permease [Phycicoccus sp. MAQZ13P-2]|uniref:permease n=1 Tax=Phycicoccus mangrovi TaxID=2840470 RepID=UPI001BFFF1E5|nr:permease [Phycicoccus mangrovi]MBT9257465.1 permease [Phycicoccus mangrovi]MBT9275661.1 permease [Phycicoccus mangrovi]